MTRIFILELGLAVSSPVRSKPISHCPVSSGSTTFARCQHKEQSGGQLNSVLSSAISVEAVRVS